MERRAEGQRGGLGGGAAGRSGDEGCSVRVTWWHASRPQISLVGQGAFVLQMSPSCIYVYDYEWAACSRCPHVQ